MTDDYPGARDLHDEVADLRQCFARLDEWLSYETAERTKLEEQLSREVAEREALQKLLVPLFNEFRKEVELNAQYFTERLEQSRARPAGGSDEDTETTEEIFRGMVRWFYQLAERIEWLEGAFVREGAAVAVVGGATSAS